jgi:hypothetical protein
MGLFDHITRPPSGLPSIVHDKHKLYHKHSERHGTSGYKDVYTPFGVDGFICDLPNLSTGWAVFQKGVAGRSLQTVSALAVLAGNIAPPIKPVVDGASFSPLGLLPVASQDLQGELDVTDTAICKAVEALLTAYLEAPEAEQSLIPLVIFTSATCTLTIAGWTERDEDFWGPKLYK